MKHHLQIKTRNGIFFLPLEMPPATRRCPLSAISGNIVPSHSPKPYDCLAVKRSAASNTPTKTNITVLNAKPATDASNEVSWLIGGTCPPETPRIRCHSPIYKPSGSQKQICSQSLSSLIPGLNDSKVRNRLRALKTVCDLGQLLQRSIAELTSSEERRKVDDQNCQADAALRSFQLQGGCSVLVRLLDDGHKGVECGALMSLALLCAAGPASFCAQVCSDGGLCASVLTFKRPWGDKCLSNMMGLLLNCSSYAVCHSSFCEKDICDTLAYFCRLDEHDLQLTNYACSCLANLCGGSSTTRKFLMSNYHDSLQRMIFLAKKGCSAAVLAVKNLCCCCSSLECAALSITGNDLIQLVHHLLPLSADSAEMSCSALQCYCLHSPLETRQVRSLVDFLPHSGMLMNSVLSALCNVTLHSECPSAIQSTP